MNTLRGLILLFTILVFVSVHLEKCLASPPTTAPGCKQIGEPCNGPGYCCGRLRCCSPIWACCNINSD
ncbi:unnamed protein product [Allacma fusca]|uniref:Cysteine rich secreted protein n=1 Tax=Allacma fusca TaxID=39272 RepID=A0A8J2P217_9HEXA|nr:unnamed protein product [Allacma fusca]